MEEREVKLVSSASIHHPDLRFPESARLSALVQLRDTRKNCSNVENCLFVGINHGIIPLDHNKNKVNVYSLWGAISQFDTYSKIAFFLVRMEPFGVDCNVRTDIFEFYYLAEL